LEWEKGARGVDGRRFPWGNDADQAKCRCHNNCGGGFGPPFAGNGPTSSVWDYPQGRSPWGLLHMAGNVTNYCAETTYDAGAYARYFRGDLTPPPAGSDVVMRGSGWWASFGDEYRCAFRAKRGGPRSEATHGEIGFRVAKSSKAGPGKRPTQPSRSTQG
jgi:formylglycine-generating enzyme required for sulfatase activity